MNVNFAETERSKTMRKVVLFVERHGKDLVIVMKGQEIKDLPAIAQTLCIPLAARAKESSHSAPLLSDRKAEKLFAQLDLSSIITDGWEISTLGILARSNIIDQEIAKLISVSQRTVVINLGAGLDTRFYRLKQPADCWYDIDLPPVIALRERLLEKEETITAIASSILEPEWIAKIDVSAGSTVILIAEGLLMYFTREQVVKILGMLSQAFPGAHLFFDVVHSFFVNKKISSEFLWGIDKARETETISPGAVLFDFWIMGDLYPERQSALLRFFRWLPSTKNRSQILHCQLKNSI